MEHLIHLNNGPFQKIKNKTKTVEMRLYDEKRKLIKVGDIITFENRLNGEELKVEVINLRVFNNFTELYNNYDKISIGYDNDENANPSDMEEYYSKEEQAKYGTLAIEIKVID